MKKPEPITPGPNQESVWDYPRPPRLEDVSKEIKIVARGITIAASTRAKRVLETSHPPVYYVPPEDVRMDLLTISSHESFCEWKGRAAYFDLLIGEERNASAAWAYLSPTPAFSAIRLHLAFYPQRVDDCFVDGERARPQPGGFYGGWITNDLVGPFKGEPGTLGW